MTLVLPRCRHALVVAPHPDDEAIGAWALMATLRARGVKVRVLVAADGAASHPGSVRWPPARLAAERRRETRRAMATLGIPPDRVRFLALPDGALADHAARLRAGCAQAIRQMPGPVLVVGPVADDDHPDHRAVAAALGRRRLARWRLGYRVWPLGATPRDRLALRLDERARAAKRRVVRSYRTQAGRITDSATGMTMRPHHLRAFAGPAERFRVLP